MNNYPMINKPEKPFTTKEKNGIIKEKVRSAFPTMAGASSQSSAVADKAKIRATHERNNSLISHLQQNSSKTWKIPSGIQQKQIDLQPKPTPLPLKPSKTKPKASTLLFTPELKEKTKLVKLPYIIPGEKKERDRLERLTGAYDLRKVDSGELRKHIQLEKKTPDDYHDVNQPYHIAKKRIDEAFGPKTDFSISNFENNFDKMNKEEQAMLTYKMQREFNKTGYTDSNGDKLKEDGIFGDKTKSAYNAYKKDNADDLNKLNVDFQLEPMNYSYGSKENKKETKSSEHKQEKYDTDYNKNIRVTKYNGNKKETDRDKEVLTKEDYEKVKIYQSVYNYAKEILKDEAIADSAHREAVAIRSQEKYSEHEDYGPKRVKDFDPSKGLQYVSVIGYTDNDYEYSDTKDTATITVSRPLTANDIEWITGSVLGTISNANAFTDAHPYLNMFAGLADWVLSKTNPLYNKIKPGDVAITVRKHKGNYKGAYVKEYCFYYDIEKQEIYYAK